MSEVRTITEAELATLQLRRSTYEQQLAEYQGRAAAAQAEADALWPAGEAGGVDSTEYGAWAAKADEALQASQQVLAAYANLRSALAQLAAAGDTAAQEHLASAMPQGAAALVNAVAARRKPKRQRAPRQQQPDPPGAEALRAAMDTHKPGYDEYVAAREAGEREVQELHRPAYTAYKQAQRALYAARKAAGAAAPAEAA